MSAINFNTANQTFRQLLGNGLTYRVPRFQRDYSWGQDEWDDLWQDIQEMLVPGGEPAHYMGYLVLQTQNQKAFDVIDGQQRLTTLSLLVLAVLKGLDDLVRSGVDVADNGRRGEQLRNSYIGYLDPVTLIQTPKLSLNRNNDAYYKDYLIPLARLPQRGLKASEHLLRKGFEWFCKQVRDRYGSSRSGQELALFLDSLSDKLFFTVITVTDELNAFKVFETLNARGVRLSPTDLLKNHLFSVVSRESTHDGEIDTLERRWEAMVGKLGGESFPGFLRVHWNSRRRFARESELFKTIRGGISDKQGVFRLLREMEEDLDTYAALPHPEDSLWTEEQRRSIRELRMFSVRQPWPVLLAGRRALANEAFGDLLRACSVISFRYNVIGNLATGEQERLYNAVAQRIAGGELAQAGEVIRALAPLYVSDEDFRNAFSNKELRTTAARNAQVVRYILFSLERQVSERDFEMASAKYTLEHVLPESPGDQWPQFSDEEWGDAVYRLGNFALLEARSNRQAGNVSFAVKREEYRKSAFEVTRRMAEHYSEWNIGNLAERQRWMAKQAVGIWKISQLG